LHPFGEKWVKARSWIVPIGLLCEGDSPFSQALKHQEIQVALLGEFDGRLDAIAGITGS
jgi:hypothetical protein